MLRRHLKYINANVVEIGTKQQKSYSAVATAAGYSFYRIVVGAGSTKDPSRHLQNCCKRLQL
jgi:hypothetical protein